MPRKAIKNTHAYETIGGVDVRRRVRAGTTVPDHYHSFEAEGAVQGGPTPGQRVIGETGGQDSASAPAPNVTTDAGTTVDTANNPDSGAVAPAAPTGVTVGDDTTTQASDPNATGQAGGDGPQVPPGDADGKPPRVTSRRSKP